MNRETGKRLPHRLCAFGGWPGILRGKPCTKGEACVFMHFDSPKEANEYLLGCFADGVTDDELDAASFEAVIRALPPGETAGLRARLAESAAAERIELAPLAPVEARVNSLALRHRRLVPEGAVAPPPR